MNFSQKISKRSPWILASLRFILFASLAVIGSCLYHTPLSSAFCILPICVSIVLSDVFDGAVARLVLAPDKVFKFRYFDSVVDKVGISIALLGFFASGRLPLSLFLFLFFRELALLACGISAVFLGYPIYGDNMGRIYYCILFVMVALSYPSDAPIMSFETTHLFTLFLLVFAFMNLVSHLYSRFYHKHPIAGRSVRAS